MKINVRQAIQIYTAFAIILICVPIYFLYLANQKGLTTLQDNNEVYSNLLLQLSTIDSELRNSRFHAYAGFMHDSNLSVAHYHAHPYELHIDAVEKNLKSADEAWKIVLSRADTTQAEYNIISLKDQYDAYMMAAARPVLQAMKTRDWDSIVKLITAAIPEYAEFSNSISDIQAKISSDTQNKYDQYQIDIEEFSTTLYICYAILVSIFAIFSLWAARKLLGPLKQSTSAAEKISAGDLTSNGFEQRHDEFGLLQDAMDRMRLQLVTMISKIKDESKIISGQSVDLKKISKTVEGSVSQQKGRLTSATNELDSLSGYIEDISTSTENTNMKAIEAQEFSRLNAERVGEAESGIMGVSEKLLETSSKVEDLSNKVEEIGGITDVIQDVASQTNLLALNAAIEAARAGEQGRGFAVVADEVRGLAETTTQSVDKISKMISSIQHNALKTVESMRASCEMTESVVSVTQATKSSIEEVNQKTSTVKSLVSEINSALDEQKSSSIELSKDMETISQLSNENDLLVSNLSKASDDLLSISDQLGTAVSGFKIPEEK
ncbi:MAG: methyl-accepting chemotaxis protein [Cellvibrionaceae bacterium]|nr:methyl-accepting chemotaxis protein [Cellvibrionaceae bacterium]MCV6627107.1 methyl-accepting chemotaxis protein [Cellvibrionaceae bacterium]